MVIWSGVVRADGSALPSARSKATRQAAALFRGAYRRARIAVAYTPFNAFACSSASCSNSAESPPNRSGWHCFILCRHLRTISSLLALGATPSTIHQSDVTVWPPGHAVVVVFFAPRVLALLAAASAPLLFVVFPLGVDVWPRFVVSASRALCSSWYRRCSASLNCACA
jgi:hypothetical protein